MVVDTSDSRPSLGRSATDSAPELVDMEFMDLLAYIYLQHGLAEKAAVLLAARDQLAPDETRTLLVLALAQLRSAQPGKALETLERLAIRGAMSAEFHLIRAQALQALARHSEAESAMRAYLAMQPSALSQAQAASSSCA